MRPRSPARPVTEDGGTRPTFVVEATQRARVYENVVSQLQHLVTSGQLNPGDKLPSERELCRMFQVGRSSIRDAIRVLDTMGFVRSRHGGGTIVQDLSPQSIVSPLSTLLTRKRALVEDLMDVRCIFEPPLAARAALHATSDELARLRVLVEQQEASVARGEACVDQDAEFHAIIARAAGNPVMLSVLDVLLALLAETRERTLQGASRTRRSAAAHRRILRAIERRSPAAAEKAMRQHIAGIHALISRKLRALSARTSSQAPRGGTVPASRAARGPARRRASRRDG